jgi:hypothetical protein
MRKRVDDFAALIKEINEVLKMTLAERVFLITVFVAVFAVSIIVFNYVMWG